MLSRPEAAAEVAALLSDPDLDLPQAVISRSTDTKTATFGTSRDWDDVHTYSKCLVWADTQRGTEGTIGGREESLKRFKAAVVKDAFTPETKDRLIVEGQTFEITGSNLGAVDDFCLTFDLVLVEES